jgi:hypothetical protein
VISRSGLCRIRLSISHKPTVTESHECSNVDQIWLKQKFWFLYPRKFQRKKYIRSNIQTCLLKRFGFGIRDASPLRSLGKLSGNQLIENVKFRSKLKQKISFLYQLLTNIGKAVTTVSSNCAFQQI